MRSIVELLGYLRLKNASLSLDGDALKCSAPQGVLTKDLREELAVRKQEIVAFLQASRQPSGLREQNIAVVDRSGPLPLSFAQQRLWFLNQLDPQSAVYNIGIPLRMIGLLDVPALERSLAEIVMRHEDLRTTFVEIDGAPRAVISDGTGWSLAKIDARHLLDDGPGSELRQRATASWQELFDITRGPLFRAELLIVAPDNHLLVLTMHHLISDGWSMGVLLAELAELYRAYATGREPSLPPLTIQYVDFAAWQRKWLESGELDRQLPYWKKQLAGSPPVLGFPADHRRLSVDAARGCRAKLVIPMPLVKALEQLSQSHGVTLFMTLLAAFKVLLARYSGQDDIVLGSLSANRSRAELNPLIGFFVNNLVLRTDLSGNPSFIELLGRVRDVTLGAYEHQDVPFDKLVQVLRPERSLDHSPLFQVMFTLQNFRLDDLVLPHVVTTVLEPEMETARFDLTVEVYPRHGELWAYFDYNADLYQPETIAGIQQHYLEILHAVAEDATRKIGAISLLSDAERRKLLIEWNRTDAPIPAGVCFQQRFEEHACRTPARVAVIAGDCSLTYGELEKRANQIAEHLRARGAGPEKLVALCLKRSADLVAAMLGVAKSGAAYVPLDPAYPKGRISNILEDAAPLVVLTTRDLIPLLPQGPLASARQIICLDEIAPDPSGGSKTYLTDTYLADTSDQRAQENLAYVIFTSGSTGRPKGVQITHRSLVNFLESMRAEPGFTADDVLLAVTTPSFDIAALELLLPLYSGATVCIALEPGDPASLLADLARYRPTVMQATPATWKLLIAAGWKGDPELKILCGGEALDPDLARSLLVRSGSLWNMYGPTETTIWSAVLRVEHAGAATVPVGRPIRNTGFYVLDALGQPAPLGVAGELWIGGEGVARGYLNRPELTSERFIPSPFSHRNSSSRLYRTGDMVRYRADGTLDFLGRMDHQVKFRGFRIELGEIENALRDCDGILDAVTLLREDNGDKRLIGYIACGENEPPANSSLRDRLRAVLPEYMVPASFVSLKQLPRLPNGKLDRAALPAPERDAAANQLAFTPPASTLQQTIAAIFCNLLNIERVGLDDNFFDLGAHSLQIVKAHAELNQKKIDTKIALISFFQYPTIRSLAAFIEQGSRKEPAGSLSSAESISQVRAL